MTDMRAESLGSEVAALCRLSAGAHQADHIFLHMERFYTATQLAHLFTVEQDHFTVLMKEYSSGSASGLISGDSAVNGISDRAECRVSSSVQWLLESHSTHGTRMESAVHGAGAQAGQLGMPIKSDPAHIELLDYCFASSFNKREYDLRQRTSLKPEVDHLGQLQMDQSVCRDK